MEKQSGLPIKILCFDRGGELTSNEFAVFCEKNGVHSELTAPYTPERNGVAEQKNRTVVEMARSMMTAASLLKKFWVEEVATIVYILNISPTKAALNRSLYEAWMSRKPGVSHLRIFGCIAYTLDKFASRHKLHAKSEKCIFVGYSP